MSEIHQVLSASAIEKLKALSSQSWVPSSVPDPQPISPLPEQVQTDISSPISVNNEFEENKSIPKSNGLDSNIDKRAKATSKSDIKSSLHFENFEDQEIFINIDGSHKLGPKESLDTNSLL